MPAAKLKKLVTEKMQKSGSVERSASKFDKRSSLKKSLRNRDTVRSKSSLGRLTREKLSEKQQSLSEFKGMIRSGSERLVY